MVPTDRRGVRWWSSMRDQTEPASTSAPSRGPAGRHVRARGGRPAHLGDRPLQLPLHVLHAGRGARLAPQGGDPDLRGAHPPPAAVRGPRGAIAQGHRRRADGPSRPARRSLGMFRDAGPDLDISITTNGVLLDPTRGAPGRGGRRPRHRVVRFAAPPSLRRHDPPGRAREGAARACALPRPRASRRSRSTAS